MIARARTARVVGVSSCSHLSRGPSCCCVQDPSANDSRDVHGKTIAIVNTCIIGMFFLLGAVRGCDHGPHFLGRPRSLPSKRDRHARCRLSVIATLAAV